MSRSQREAMSRSQREYEGDVVYGVWRLGGNPDALDVDRMGDHWREGDDVDVAVQNEMRRQRRGLEVKP